MSIQDIFVTAGKKEATGLYHGFAYLQKDNGWVMQLADERGWPDAETAIAEIQKMLIPEGAVVKLYEGKPLNELQ